MKHSRSRSITSRRSYSRSPYRRSRRRSPSPRRPPSPPPISTSRKRSRYSNDKRSISRSKSPSYKKNTSRRRHTRSRSRSRSGSRARNSYVKSSRNNNRENPLPSRCIGIFGLSLYTTQPQIREIFSKYGPIERIQVVVDAQTGRSRGFCFIYYENLSDAKAACDNCCGMEIDGRRIRVAFSITERPHTPTPGVYKGQSARILRERYRAQRYHSKSRHSPEMYSKSHRSRYERSRSRSYSPRRYRY